MIEDEAVKPGNTVFSTIFVGNTVLESLASTRTTRTTSARSSRNFSTGCHVMRASKSYTSNGEAFANDFPYGLHPSSYALCWHDCHLSHEIQLAEEISLRCGNTTRMLIDMCKYSERLVGAVKILVRTAEQLYPEAGGT